MENKNYFYCLAIIIAISPWNIMCAATPNNEKKPVDEQNQYTGTKHYDKDGNHNPEYDQEAFLGDEARTLENLSPEESRKRLGIIADKIDQDKDGLINHTELKDWIKYTQEKFVRDNVDRTWKSHNPDGLEKISWEDYSKLVYGFMKEMTLQDIHKKENGLSYKGLYDRDRRRWTASDQDNDGLLTKSEFFSFLHPEESPHMRDLIVLETIEDMDTDKDGKISLDEYIDNMYQGEEGAEKPQWIETEKNNFKKYRDTDGDGFLAGDEVKSIIIPEDYDHAEAEARHLIYEADKNDDKVLTKEEIYDKYDVFLGSQATDFGEALMRHDEF